MARPQLVYDDSCTFCTWVAEHAIYYDPFELVGIFDVTDEQRERLSEDYEECSHLITDDAVYSCGESAERTLAWNVSSIDGEVHRSPTSSRLSDSERTSLPSDIGISPLDSERH